jgi:hypothetical protein
MLSKEASPSPGAVGARSKRAAARAFRRARATGAGKKAVKSYLINAFRKLQASCRAEVAVTFARRMIKPIAD